MSHDKYSDSHTIEVCGDDLKVLGKAVSVSSSEDEMNIISAKNLSLEAGGTISIVSAPEDLTDAFVEITSHNITLTANGNINLVSGDQYYVNAPNGLTLASGDDIDLNATDIRLTATDDIELTGSDNIDLTATDNITLTTDSKDIKLDSADDIVLDAEGTVTIEAEENTIMLTAGDDIRLTAADKIIVQAEDHINFFCNDFNVATDAESIYTSTSTEDGAGHVLLSLKLAGSASESSKWLRFLNSSGDEKGSIQIARTTDDPEGDYVWTSRNANGLIMYADWNDDGDDAMTAPGNARFVSGLADFGEFFKVGDLAEWPELTQESHKPGAGNGAILGASEGIVVWVRNNRFFREALDNNCIPMFVTKRSIVTGDGLALLKEDGSKYKGEVLSFCGKLPVLTKGRIREGDYIVPEVNTNYCIGVPFDEVTFDQYKRAMGRSLGSASEVSILKSDDPKISGKETEFSIVMCAIGIK